MPRSKGSNNDLSGCAPRPIHLMNISTQRLFRLRHIRRRIFCSCTGRSHRSQICWVLPKHGILRSKLHATITRDGFTRSAALVRFPFRPTNHPKDNTPAAEDSKSQNCRQDLESATSDTNGWFDEDSGDDGDVETHMSEDEDADDANTEAFETQREDGDFAMDEADTNANDDATDLPEELQHSSGRRRSQRLSESHPRQSRLQSWH